MSLRRWLLPLLGVGALSLAACEMASDDLWTDIQERRLEKAGVAVLDSTGTAPRAGLSFLRRIEVQAVDPEEIGADTASAGFRRFQHRCGTCHAPPDPRLRTAGEWEGVFSRMKKNMRDAGLLPLGEADQRVILAFLQRHARERR